jgi:hypothetical protein
LPDPSVAKRPLLPLRRTSPNQTIDRASETPARDAGGRARSGDGPPAPCILEFATNLASLEEGLCRPAEIIPSSSSGCFGSSRWPRSTCGLCDIHHEIRLESMSFTLADVVPWGRSYDEYVEMFSLTAGDLRRPILGCGDGPAAFNAVATRDGCKVISVDPLYEFSVTQVARRIEDVFGHVVDETARNSHEFVWKHVESIDALSTLRRAAMDAFLADYDRGRVEGRYVQGGLPSLPFSDGEFGLALCSHFLFLYSAHFDQEFHVASIRELCRVASEVRIFPLNELGARPSRHLDAVVEACREAGMNPEIVHVSYEFQRGANRFLRLRSPSPA